MTQTKLKSGKFDKSNEIYLRIKKGDKKLKVMKKGIDELSEVHEVKTMEELLNLATPDSVEYLAEDFRKYLIFYANAIAMVKDSNPKLKELKNTEIFQSVFKWINDGKTDFLGVSLNGVKY